MSTTRKGKYLSRTRPYDVKLKKLWRIDSAVGSLTMHYRMGHSLEQMGVKLEGIDWSQCSRRTLSTTSEASSENSIIEDDGSSHNDDQPHHYLLTTNIDNIKKQPIDDDDDDAILNS